MAQGEKGTGPNGKEHKVARLMEMTNQSVEDLVDQLVGIGVKLFDQRGYAGDCDFLLARLVRAVSERLDVKLTDDEFGELMARARARHGLEIAVPHGNLH